MHTIDACEVKRFVNNSRSTISFGNDEGNMSLKFQFVINKNIKILDRILRRYQLHSPYMQ